MPIARLFQKALTDFRELGAQELGEIKAVRGYDLLSEQEQQVFRLVVQGRSTKAIADLLFVSPKTVEKHRTSIMAKLGVQGSLELLKYAIKIGIVDPAL